jgi:hypothetical protein
LRADVGAEGLTCATVANPDQIHPIKDRVSIFFVYYGLVHVGGWCFHGKGVINRNWLPVLRIGYHLATIYVNMRL